MNIRDRYNNHSAKRPGCIAFAAWLLCLALLSGCSFRPSSGPVPASTAGESLAATEPAQPEYLDTPVYKELQRYATGPSGISLQLSQGAWEDFLERLEAEESDFSMAEYYRLEDALEMYRNTQVRKSTDTTLLTQGLLDGDKLFRQVLENNSKVWKNGRNTLNSFYSALDDSDIQTICGKIAQVINEKREEIDLQKVANTLQRLTMFRRSGSTSNAYVSTELAFVYNPNMIELYTRQQDALGGSPETVWDQVIVHEIMHLIQHGANDGNDANGVEVGVCRQYNLSGGEKLVPVDSLYNSWILEAGAELAMTEVVGVPAGTYQKKISYARSYNLSRFYEVDTRQALLEVAAFGYDLEAFFEALDLQEAQQPEFLKFMYSVEITQYDPEDFWESYEAATGVIHTDEEKTGLRMGIRTDAVTYMTRNFFRNLANAVRDGAVTDLDTVFYLLRLWELDTWNHLNYTQYSSLAYADAFVLWYNDVQEAFLTAAAESSGLDPAEVLELYDAYCLQIRTEAGDIYDNCDLSGLSGCMQLYIPNLKEQYGTGHYSRIRDVAQQL